MGVSRNSSLCSISARLCNAASVFHGKAGAVARYQKDEHGADQRGLAKLARPDRMAATPASENIRVFICH